MKNINLIMFLLAACSLAFVSCKKDDDGCTKCKQPDLPFVKECEVSICEDGSHSDNGATLCLGIVDVLLSGLETQEEKIQAMSDAGYNCK